MQSLGLLATKKNLFLKKQFRQGPQNKEESGMKKNKGLLKKIMIISEREIDNETKFYDWRIKTQFPISKIQKYKVKKCDKNHSILQIQYENYLTNLSQLNDIPLFKILYLLKQSIIGYERLYNKVGSFIITSKMIFLNHKNQCKVWFNENFIINKFNKTNYGQNQFLINIYKVFQAKVKQNKAANAFFSELQNIKNFFGVLLYIEKFSTENKICIPNFFHFNKTNKNEGNQKLKICQSAKNIALERQLIFTSISDKKQNHCFQFKPNLTFNRKPIFVKDIPQDVLSKNINNSRQLQQNRRVKRVRSLNMYHLLNNLNQSDPQKNKKIIPDKYQKLDQSETFFEHNKITSIFKPKQNLKIEQLTKFQQIDSMKEFNSQEINISSVFSKNPAQNFIEEQLSEGQSQIFYDSYLQKEFINIYRNVEQDQNLQRIMEKISNREKNNLQAYGKIASSMHQNQENFKTP